MGLKKEVSGIKSLQKLRAITPLGSKKGAIDWTVGKLMSLVLGVLLLVMIIYGVSSGGLNPLIKRMGDSMDQVGALVNKVLISSGVKDKDPLAGCYTEPVESLSGGKNYLDQMGLTGDERSLVTIKICSDNVCELQGGGIGPYGARNNGLIDLDTFEPVDFPILAGDLQKLKFENELYNSAVDFLENVGARDYYEERNTREITFYGKPRGIFDDSEIYATWKNGVWKVSLGEEDIPFGEVNSVVIDNAVLEYFYLQVDDGFADEVYYKESSIVISATEDYIGPADFNGEPIGTLWGDSSDNRLDSREELDKLKNSFNQIKSRLLEEASPTLEDGDNFKSLINGKQIEVDGKIFSLSIFEDSNNKYILILLDSGIDKYYLEFDPNSKVFGNHNALVSQNEDNPLGTVRLREFPIRVLSFDGRDYLEVNREEHYKLPREIFEKAYSGTISYNFLKTKCR